ncbi:hypothetical protein QE363_002795 [Sphingomonas sp. SORGH_AS870]|uniref:PilZ domain-containing protein n=1 Tax=Sphingomonas sp. SORGH_AS_0870 TaxID=3041801 RepID=UPI0028554F4D|nr:PilZ domain-containing protein [Sphingomonas sp. SORGH_AS_0870]MDR6147002.1 hypothetical protein [Sphingomonas sp. SORGH_AS_0870]
MAEDELDEGHRNGRRDSLLLMAAMTLGDDPVTREVRVRNISEGGLMAELPVAVEIGTPIQFDLRGIGLVAGRVAWCTQGRVGVAFDRPIDPKLVRKPVGGGTSTPEYAKPNMAGRTRPFTY